MTTPEDHDLQKLIEQIDSLDIKMPKQQRIFDTDNEIMAVESNLVSLRRMLRQHHNVKQVVVTQQEGQFQIGARISSLITQLKRLRAYRAELEALSDDEEEVPTPPQSDED